MQSTASASLPPHSQPASTVSEAAALLKAAPLFS